MKSAIAKKLHDTLAVTVYLDHVPQGLTPPCCVVREDEAIFERGLSGAVEVRVTYTVFAHDVAPCAVLCALERVGDFYCIAQKSSGTTEKSETRVTFRAVARLEETVDEAPLMGTVSHILEKEK